MAMGYRPESSVVHIETLTRTDGEIKFLIDINDKRLVSEQLKEKIQSDSSDSCSRFYERKTGINSAKLCLEFIVDIIDCSTYGGLRFDLEIEKVKSIFATTARLLEQPKGRCLTIEQERSAIKYLTDNLGLTASNKRPVVSDHKLQSLFLKYIKTMTTTNAYNQISIETGLKLGTVKAKINRQAKDDSHLTSVKSYSSEKWAQIEKSHNEIDLVDKIMIDKARQEELANLIALRAQIDEEINALTNGS